MISHFYRSICISIIMLGQDLTGDLKGKKDRDVWVTSKACMCRGVCSRYNVMWTCLWFLLLTQSWVRKHLEMIQSAILGAGVMAHQGRALSDSRRGPRFVSQHAHSSSQPSVNSRQSMFSSDLWGYHTHMVHICSCRHTHTHEITNNYLKR